MDETKKLVARGMKKWEWAVAIPLMLLVPYVVAYLSVMQTDVSEVSTGGPLFTLRRPYFSQDQATEITLRKIFKPALFIDSKIRPGFWGMPPEL